MVVVGVVVVVLSVGVNVEAQTVSGPLTTTLPEASRHSAGHSWLKTIIPLAQIVAVPAASAYFSLKPFVMNITTPKAAHLNTLLDLSVQAERAPRRCQRMPNTTNCQQGASTRRPIFRPDCWTQCDREVSDNSVWGRSLRVASKHLLHVAFVSDHRTSAIASSLVARICFTSSPMFKPIEASSMRLTFKSRGITFLNYHLPVFGCFQALAILKPTLYHSHVSIGMLRGIKFNTLVKSLAKCWCC